jgi:hypothetical protein
LLGNFNVEDVGIATFNVLYEEKAKNEEDEKRQLINEEDEKRQLKNEEDMKRKKLLGMNQWKNQWKSSGRCPLFHGNCKLRIKRPQNRKW